MQRKIPRNIRQVGYANENEKVYLEDYVDTYLKQLCEQAEEAPQGAFLIGEQVTEENNRQTYLFGAVRMQKLTRQGNEIKIPEGAWKEAEELCKKYFENGKLVGWYLAATGYASGVDAAVIHQHEKYLDKPGSLFLVRDPVSEETNFYLYREKELQRLGGYCIYFEKNPAMQNYMIDERKGIGIEPENVVPDKAAQSFRQIIREKEEKKNARDMHRSSYTLSAALVLVVLVMGIAAFNNYEGLLGAQSAIRASAARVIGKKAADESAEGLRDAEGQNEDASKADVAEEAADGQNAAGDIKSEQTSDQNTADAQNASNQNYYTVKKGDTLAGISRTVYGNASKVNEICNLNGIENVDLIIEGQKILLP
jgi:LysM repeat protein